MVRQQTGRALYSRGFPLGRSYHVVSKVSERLIDIGVRINSPQATSPLATEYLKDDLEIGEIFVRALQ
jgi:hypothetical protein